MLGDSGWEICGWCRVKSQDAGLAGSGISRQRDRGDVRPGEAGALLPPVCCESGEGCVIDTGRTFWAERSFGTLFGEAEKEFTALGYKVANARISQ